jgi:parvulin-like peptidyl-prolyl isomerase
MDHPDLKKVSDNQAGSNKHRERLGRRELSITVIGYFIVVFLIIGIPFYLKMLAPWRHMILQVGEVTVTTHDLIKRMRLTPASPGINQLESATHVLQEIQNLELIRQEALKRKIEISEQELDREIRRRVTASAAREEKFEDLYPSWLRRIRLKEEEYRKWVKLDIYREKLFKTFIEKMPENAEHIHLMIMVTGTAIKAKALQDRLQRGEDFSRLAREASTDIESARKGGDLGWIPKGVDELTTPGQILAMGLLTKTKSEAEQIREKIQSGMDLGELVRIHSLDKESRDAGGSLGWFSADPQEGKPYAQEVYELKPGEVSRPIQTPEGFWIIKLIEKTPRGKLIDDIAFNLPIGKASPPINAVKGFYFLKIAAREQRPLSQEHKAIWAEKAFREWLAAIAEKGRKEGWIRWDWGSETYNWVITHLD